MIGYIAPIVKLLGQENLIFEQRQRKLEQTQRNRIYKRTGVIHFSEPTDTSTRSEELNQGRAGAGEEPQGKP